MKARFFFFYFPKEELQKRKGEISRINLAAVRDLQWKTTKNTPVVQILSLLFIAGKGEHTHQRES